MFRVVLFAATLSLSTADYLSSRPAHPLVRNLVGDDQKYHSGYYGNEAGINFEYKEQPGKYDPNQVFTLFTALWTMLSDKSGYVPTLEAGKATALCEEIKVKGTYIEGPSMFKVYGLFNTKIEFLSVSSKDKKPENGLVKLWVGGVGQPYVILEFKTPTPAKASEFAVKMCWAPK